MTILNITETSILFVDDTTILCHGRNVKLSDNHIKIWCKYNFGVLEIVKYINCQKQGLRKFCI